MSENKGNRAVLIVDNDEEARQSIALWVEMTCCDVIEADDAKKAVQLAQGKAPKLILMDMDLPGMSGFAATELIRVHKETNQIPIVAMSSPDVEFNWRQEAHRVGCVECVSKPLNFETISELVDRYIPA